MSINQEKEPWILDAEVFAKAFSHEGLRAGWARVWRNAGAAGGDGQTVEAFQRAVVQRLAELQRDLANGRYEPGPYRRVMIPKQGRAEAGRNERPLDIPCVRDRVAQTAATLVLAPLLDREFEDASFAYRAGKSVQQAVRRVEALSRQGFVHVVDADIERFFERVSHDVLLRRLGQSMSAGPLTELISLWLEHGGKQDRQTGRQAGRGLAQGSPLSPVLANLYLDELDEQFAKKDVRLIRFADDFVLLARSQSGAEAALDRVERLLADQGLTLNRDKTRVTDFDQGFRFLGHAFVRSFVFPAPNSAEAPEPTEDLLRLIGARDRDEDRRMLAQEDRARRRARAGLDPGQRMLYLNTPGRRLTTRNFAFEVLEREEPGYPDRTPILDVFPADLDRIEISPAAEIDVAALRHAVLSQTSVAFVDGHGATQGLLAPAHGPRAARQLAQARAVLDEARRLDVARAFVDARLRNQRALLRRLNRDKNNPSVVKALAEINRLILRLTVARDLDELMGFEGRATALYWPNFGRLITKPFKLRKRERDAPDTPVNILLNITAGLVLRDAGAALVRAGLHPGFGFLHTTANHKDALTYDFAEAFRGPLAESAVAAALNRKAITMEMFHTLPSGQVRLRPAGHAAMIRAYEQAAARASKGPLRGQRRSWRAQMTDYAILLAQSLEKDTEIQLPILDY